MFEHEQQHCDRIFENHKQIIQKHRISKKTAADQVRADLIRLKII